MNILNYKMFNEAKCREFQDFDIETKTIVDTNTGNSYSIFFGKNAKSNDFLTHNFSGKYAKAIRNIEPSINDVWMHTKGVPGSHLIIKTIKDDIIPMNVIKDAALIAKKNSKAKDTVDAEIVWCKKDFVSKTPIGQLKSILDDINLKKESGIELDKKDIEILDKSIQKEGRVFVDYTNSNIILI